MPCPTPTPPSTWRRRRAIPASRPSRSASCTGSPRPWPRWGCSGRSRGVPGVGEGRDYILELLIDHSTAGLTYDECVGVDYQRLHADPEAALADIVDRYHRVAQKCDAVVIVGSDYTDVTSPSELSTNARIAVNLGAPVVLAVRRQGPHPRRRRARRRAVPRRTGRPARAHRGRRGQPLRSRRTRGRRAGAAARGAQELRAARGAAARRAVGGRAEGRRARHRDQR